MDLTDTDIRNRLSLGEDSRWEFKQIEFSGDRPKSPPRDALADEMTAFANAEGGVILCGVSDSGELQGMSPEQAAALNLLLAEVSSDAIEPSLRIHIHHRKLDGKLLVVAEVPRGNSMHECAGRAYVRVGSSKCRMGGDERLRLAQSRVQSRYLWYDRQMIDNTGFETLLERLWAPLLSLTGGTNPRRALKKLKLLTSDENGVDRATVAGVLLCTDSPQDWIPNATIMATMYRGKDRASAQLDAKEIQGSLPVQIADAVQFVGRNMRVPARKTPAREENPQYSLAAVFEAIVNAVVHRDYSMFARRIRISMFQDRVEIDSPGLLPNGMTIDEMDSSQAARNNVLTDVFGRIPVGNIPGSEHRVHMMEKRGDGVSIIFNKTQELVGVRPSYRIADGTNLVLTIPAAKFEITPSDAIITVHAAGAPIVGADVLVLFPNKTWQRATTDERGEVDFNLYTTHLPMKVYAAMSGYAAGFAQEWIPYQGGLVLELNSLKAGGSVIFPKSTGNIPGLYGRLNPIRDNTDRAYLYGDNVAIDEEKQQPVTLLLNKPMRLTDSYGVEMTATFIDITGQSALLEYRPFEQNNE